MKQRFISLYKFHRRFLIILAAIVALNIVYGFDARFTIINLLWILINIVSV